MHAFPRKLYTPEALSHIRPTVLPCSRGRQVMQDTDIEGLEPKDAAEYVLAFVTTLKKTEMELVSAAEDVTKWTGRVALAVEKGEEELAGIIDGELTPLPMMETLRRKVAGQG